jgi:hypothetical protein
MKKSDFVGGLEKVSFNIERGKVFLRGMASVNPLNNWANLYADDLKKAQDILNVLLEEIESVSDKEIKEVKEFREKKARRVGSGRKRMPKGISRLRGNGLQKNIERSAELISIAFRGFSMTSPEIMRFLDERKMFGTVKSQGGRSDRVYAVMDYMVSQGKAKYLGKKGRKKQWSIVNPQAKYTFKHKERSD